MEPSLDSVYNEITQPVMHSGYLYKAAALPRSGVSKKSRDGRFGARPSITVNVIGRVCLAIAN